MIMLRDTRPSSICSYLARPQLRAAALLLSASVCAPAHAEIYKWTDKQGGQHYSEHPPAGVNFEKVAPRYAPPVNPPAAQPKSEPQNGQAKAPEQQQEENARIRKQNCETVQKRLADLESSTRINIQNPDGTVQRLTEEERQAKITETQGLIKKHCD